MSHVLSFFRERQIADDPLHRELRKIPQYRNEAKEINRRIVVDCCGVEIDDLGTVMLSIEDKESFDELKKKQRELKRRLDAIDTLVEELDALFTDAEKNNLAVPIKTVAGISAYRLYIHNQTFHKQNSISVKPASLLEEKALQLWAKSGL